MPTYQYRCKDCATDLEVVQKFTDASLTDCPTCEGSLRKVYNAVGVVFKGSGFYATDSRASNAAAVKPGPASGDSGSSTSSDTSSTSTASDSGPSGSGSSGSGSSGSGSSASAPASTPASTSSTPSTSASSGATTS